MWHHFLVKTYDLKNESLQKDNLSCLTSCSTWGKAKIKVSLVAVFDKHNKTLLVVAVGVPGSSFLSSDCVTFPSVGVFFSSSFIFSFLLSDCHFAITLVISGKTWKTKVVISTGVDRSGKVKTLTGCQFVVLTLLRASLYCCSSSSIISSVYPFELCNSDSSERYSIFLWARFKMKFSMDRVVSCTAVLASCWKEEIWKMCDNPVTIR